MRVRRQIFFLFLILIFSSFALFAQGGSTSSLSGDVTDPSGLLVAGATVELTDVGTNNTQTTTTNQAGHYAFPSLQPGQYKITVKKEKFRTTTVTVTLSVAVNAAQNIKLEIGSATEVVEVKATGQELQVIDASVGNVLNTNALENLPSLSRDASALLQLQPMSAPSYNSSSGVRNTGETDFSSGGVAGALSDQNTFHIDGGDATSNTEGTGGYSNGFEGTNLAGIPTPVESIEEFRVTTNNSNTFSRSAGADVEMVTRRGTNDWHGAAYEYNQNRGYNSNLYELKQAGLPTPPWHDNRYGFRIGGPILKDKAFFFLMYEGRHFTKGSSFTRLVPSANMRAGILTYPDASGTTHTLNFNPANGALASTCGSSGTGACDPRNLGISPELSAIWNNNEPLGNDVHEGDSYNTIGYDNTVPVTSKQNDGIARLDYTFSQKWTLNAVARYYVDDALQASQIDIGGITGGKVGVPKSTDMEPLQPRFYVIGLTGRLSNNVTNDFHFDFFRYDWAWNRRDPFPQTSTLGAALQIYQESNTNGLVPMNVDTQNARSRIWDGKEYNFNDGVAWLHGNHLIQFGGEFRHQNFYHVRDDKVVGALTVPMYFAEYTSSDMSIPTAYIPPDIDPNQTTNYKKAYASMMGMIDHTAQLLTRAGDLTPNPSGTPNTNHSTVNFYDLHIADTWRFKPTLTLSYGLDWAVQTPPYEQNGLQTIMVYGTDPHATVTYADYMSKLQAAALQGNVFVPEVGFAPIRTTGLKYPNDIDWHNISPRFSLAWNPRGGKGLMDGNTVLRAGYGRYFDRENGVGLVMTPALGIGFGNSVECKGVNTSGACAGSNDPTSAWRIGPTASGWDGESPPIPTLSAITPPVVPGYTADANTPYQTLDSRIDPHRKVGVEDTWTLGFQRQFPGNLIIELGYVGRVAHHLYTVNDINQIPYMLTSGGQTFAQAYDALQKQFLANPSLLAGCAAGLGTCTVTPQPFFETQPDVVANYGGTQGFANFLEQAVGGEFENADVTTIFDLMGLNGFDALPLDQQFMGTNFSTAMGNSIYNAGYVSARKQMGHGLTAQVNYTYSHSSDNAGFGQTYTNESPTDGFNRHRDYETSYFDRRNVLNGFVLYELPFGKGHRLSGNEIANRLIGGWRLSTNLTTSDGVPQRFTNYDYADELGDGYIGNGSSWVPTGPAGYGTNGVHYVNGSLNAFANPAAVLAAYRMPFFGDKLVGGQPYRGLHRFSMDASLSKSTKITERVNLDLSLQAINVLNHQDLNDPGMDLSTASTFGALTSQYNSQRYLSIGAKIEF